MRRDLMTSAYHVAARLWLSAALFSFFLPPGERVGIWLPLHLAVVGAISVAISGAMQTFAGALTAAPAVPRPFALAQFLTVNAGAALVISGVTTRHRALTEVGGCLFTVSVLLLTAIVWRQMRRGINPRHLQVFPFYFFALAAIVAGAIIGTFLGSTDAGGTSYLALRQTHGVMNVLGWASLTIVGTLVTFLPTVLRVRMVTWRPIPAAVLFGVGLTLLTWGLATAHRWVAACGGAVYAVGAVMAASMIVRTLRVRRRREITVIPKHLVAAASWFVASTVWLALTSVFSALRDDVPAPLGEPFLIAFVGGWLVQTLLGAWLHLLPMQAPGQPEERRLMLGGIDLLADVQVGALNLGLVLLLVATLLPMPVVGRIGWVLAFAGAGAALLKAWTYPLLARLPAAERRAAVLWRSP